MEYKELFGMEEGADRCTRCGLEGKHEYNGEKWCEEHLQERMAMEY